MLLGPSYRGNAGISATCTQSPCFTFTRPIQKSLQGIAAEFATADHFASAALQLAFLIMPVMLRKHAGVNVLLFLQVLELDAMGTRHWRIVGCSAVTGAGLIDGFDWVVSDIKSRIALLD